MLMYLRSIAFYVVFYTYMGIYFALTLPFLYILPRTVWPFRFFRGLVHSMRWFLRWMVGINDEVRGVDHLHQILAKGPCIVASKHQSMWETFFLGLFLPRVCVIVKKQLLHIPLYGQYLERLRAIGIDRTQGVKALRTMINEGKKAIEAGYHILIFPEGNRSDPLEKPTYQSGIALLYEKMNVPVVPVALNAGFFWPRRKILKKPGTIVVHFLPPILPGMEKKAFLKRLEYDIENGCKNL